MTMQGMDVRAGRELAAAFERSSGQLDSARRDIDAIIRGLAWAGADADELRSAWHGHLRSGMVRCAEAMREAGGNLRRQADQQDDTSGVAHAGLLQGLGDWIAQGFDDLGDAINDGLDWIGDQIDAGLSWVGDRIEDGIEWVGDRIEDGLEVVGSVIDGAVSRFGAIWAGLGPFGEALGSLGSQFTRIFTEGRIPQPAEILASGLLVLGTGAGVVANGVTGRDLHLFDDGEPWTGTPAQIDGRVPSTLQEVIGIGHDTYESDGVTVMAVTGEDGVTRFIVAVPGTEPALSDPAGWTGNPNGRDWPANLWGMANGTSSGTEAAMSAVDAAIAQYQHDHPDAVIGDRPELLMTGHSQGGIITANMASDSGFSSRYNIQGMITNGSPIDCAEIPSDVPVLALQHGDPVGIMPFPNPTPFGPRIVPMITPTFGDMVPRLDLGGWPGSPPNVTHGYLPPAGAPWDQVANHGQPSYYNSVNPGTPGGDLLSSWQQDHPELANFLTDTPSNTTTYDVPFGRTVD